VNLCVGTLTGGTEALKREDRSPDLGI